MRKWSKFPWSANAAWVPVVSVSTCSGRDCNFHAAGERCQQSEATFNAVATAVHSSALSISASSPLRVWSLWDKQLLHVQSLDSSESQQSHEQCNKVCVFKSSGLELAVTYAWGGVPPAESGLHWLPCLLLCSLICRTECCLKHSQMCTLHHQCCLMGTLPEAAEILMEKHLRKNV